MVSHHQADDREAARRSRCPPPIRGPRAGTDGLGDDPWGDPVLPGSGEASP